MPIIIFQTIVSAITWIFNNVFLKPSIWISISVALMYFWISSIVPFLMTEISLNNDFNSMLGSLGSSIWFFLERFEFAYGLSAILTVISVRFMLRFLPFFGK